MNVKVQEVLLQERYGYMAGIIGIGHQDFEKIRVKNIFYIEKERIRKYRFAFRGNEVLIASMKNGKFCL